MAEKKMSTKKNFLKGLFVENPLFVSILGTCPALATTKSLEAAIGMGLLFTIVLICSNCLISLIKKLIPDEIRTPAYIVVIATFVTIVKMLSNAFLPELYSTLGVFISLIVVNCIVLGRAEAFASKNNVFDSLIDAIGMGVGYTMSLLVMAFFRELLGTGMFTFGKVFTFIPLIHLYVLKVPGVYDLSISIFTQPAGAFIVFGLILATLAYIKNTKKDNADAKKKAEAAKARLLKEEAAKKAAMEASK